MSSRCDDLQQILIELGPPGLRDDAEAQAHLVECTDCFTFMEALWEVDVQLRGLPELDASDELVAQTLASVRAAIGQPSATPEPTADTAPTAAPRLRRLGRVLLLPMTLVAQLFTATAALLAGSAAAVGFSLTRLMRLPWFRPLYVAPVFGGATLLAFFGIVAVGIAPLSEQSLQADLFEEPERFAKIVMDAPADADSLRQPAAPAESSALKAPESPAKKSREEKRADTQQRFSDLISGKEESGSAEPPGGSLLVGGGGGTLAGSLSNVIGTTGSGSGVAGLAAVSPDEDGQVGSRERANTPRGGSVGTSRGIAGIGSSGLTNFGAPPAIAPVAVPGPMPATLEALGEIEEEAAADSGALNEREKDRREAAQSGMLRALSKNDMSDMEGTETRDDLDDDLDPNQEVDVARRGQDKSKGKGGFAYGTGAKLGAHAGRAAVSMSTPVVMGALPKEVIQKVISQNVNQVRTCYERELQRNSNVGGKINVRFIIGATGSVPKAFTTQSSAANSDLDACITAKVRNWKFPAPAGGGIVEVNYPFVFRSAGDGPHTVTETVDTVSPARELLADRAEFDGVETREASGYWANTYVPGDPAFRLLHAQLRQHERGTLFGELADGLHLDQAAGQVAQPFDAPQSAALGVYLHADRRWAQGRTRALVQVGIKGTPRYSGSRPAMNLGIVLDLRGEFDAETGAALRALVDALSSARDTGDRFHLIVAGRPGGLIVPAESFRHGPIKVALQQLLDGTSTGDRLDLVSAMQTAVTTVVGGDDPNSTLGSSAVLLVTPRRLDAQTAALTALAHDSAVNGVPVSVVGVGDAIDIGELDRVTLAGQGNRRLLTAASEARRLVDRELSAVARVVARAVRLRIRLAPGVELVDVFGSYRLDEVRADEVRQAEVSIDRRLSRNLGVQSDRGEDEDGIQIVIPSYYAGDTHVVLLDVILPGPGPVADVRARFKDLVFLRNGVARSNLTLDRVPRVSGPLELNVLKNYIAYHVADELTAASQELLDGEVHVALQTIRRTHALLTSLRTEVPGLATDRDLAIDLAMLDDYLGLLAQGVVYGDRRTFLANSLRYAGLLKILPRPLDN